MYSTYVLYVLDEFSFYLELLTIEISLFIASILISADEKRTDNRELEEGEGCRW